MKQIIEELKKIIVGHEKPLDLLLIAIISGGHILLEGPPGVGKTLLARSLAKVMDLSFSRIQFTPDLMPSDILGVTILNPKTNEFTFKRGPIFSDLILADELNRAPARTQSALLEAMQEGQVTMDGVSHPLADCFTVIATQNPLEYDGTYGLPEAQLDRFQMKITLSPPSKEGLRALLAASQEINHARLEEVMNKESLAEVRQKVESIHADDTILDYIAELISLTQSDQQFSLGVSPRASLMLLKACKSAAYLKRRDFVIPEDIHQVALPVLGHRIRLSPEARIEGNTAEQYIEKLLKKLEVPR